MATVNEKLIAIADAIREKTGGTGKLNLDQMAIGVNDVYQAGYNAGAGTGGGGNYDESKIIEKRASGSVISLNDVSEIPHDVILTSPNNTTVKIYGKNLIDPTGTDFTIQGVNVKGVDGKFILNGTSSGEISSKYTNWGDVFSVKLKAGQYTLTLDSDNISLSGNFNINLRKSDNTSLGALNATTRTKTFSVMEETTVAITFYMYQQTFQNTEIRLQLEKGEVYTGLDSGKKVSYTLVGGQPLTVPSMCPYMYITSSDSEITVDYHKSYGAQVEYDRFWDNFQRNGTRTVYTYACYTAGWTNENFKPKYDINPTNASYMFAESSIYGDLVKILEELGVKLDLSKATNVGAVFSTTKFTRIGVVDLSSVTTATYALRVFLYNYYLKTIDKVITNPNVMYTYWFNGCNELEEVRFEGEIADSVDIHWSKKLSAQSFVSIVEHLSSTTSGKTLTVSSTAVANADWSATNYASWDELIATKTNWSFVKSN